MTRVATIDTSDEDSQQDLLLWRRLRDEVRPVMKFYMKASPTQQAIILEEHDLVREMMQWGERVTRGEDDGE